MYPQTKKRNYFGPLKNGIAYTCCKLSHFCLILSDHLPRPHLHSEAQASSAFPGSRSSTGQDRYSLPVRDSNTDPPDLRRPRASSDLDWVAVQISVRQKVRSGTRTTSTTPFLTRRCSVKNTFLVIRLTVEYISSRVSRRGAKR